MVADPPELTTNAEWRRIAIARRKELKLTQKEVGSRVGTSQNMISNIESGEVTSSGFIMPICKLLSIPAPMHFESEEQRTWSELGHLLRTKSMKNFNRVMALVESMVEEEAEGDEDRVPRKAAPARPASRK